MKVVPFGTVLGLRTRIVKRFRGGLVFKARRRLYHSTLGSSEIEKKKKKGHLQAIDALFEEGVSLSLTEKGVS